MQNLAGRPCLFLNCRAFINILDKIKIKDNPAIIFMCFDVEKLNRRREISLTLKEKLIESLDIPYEPSDLSEDISLIGSGLSLDSLDILEIVLCVESAFGIKMPEQSVPILRSFNTLVDFIMAETEARNA